MTYEPSDWDKITSTICNAYFSDMTFEQLIDCIMLTCDEDGLDAAVSATIRLLEIVHEDQH